jgi:uncharacterized protein YodC (DUF2158 family)
MYVTEIATYTCRWYEYQRSGALLEEALLEPEPNHLCIIY